MSPEKTLVLDPIVIPREKAAEEASSYKSSYDEELQHTGALDHYIASSASGKSVSVCL